MIDLKKPYLWDSINDQLKEKLNTALSVRFYQSLSQALLETAMAFQNLYSHKRQYNLLMGLGTHADEALLFLSRQGIKAIDLRTEVLSDDKKNLFCLQDMDDAITAEIYRDVYPIDEKIFRVNISHHLHFFEKNLPEIRETDVLIMNFGDHGAIALHGKRCSSLPSTLAPTLSWQHQPVPQIPWTSKPQNPAWVAKIESSALGGAQILPNLSDKRVFDRAFLIWLDLEGEALRQILIRDENLNPNHVESLSLSRWNELKLIPQFEKRNWSPEMFRGTLILSSELSADANLAAKIESSIKKLRSRSHL